MKGMKLFVTITALMGILTYQADGLARTAQRPAADLSNTAVKSPMASTSEVVTAEREKIEDATILTEKITTAATLAINNAEKQFLEGKISEIERSKIVAEQTYKRDQANNRLAELVKNSVAVVESADAEQGYMDQLMSGAYNLGQRIADPFKSGYGYTEEEKEIARAIIAELRNLLENIEREYEINVKKASTGKERAQLMTEYSQMKQDIENEIYQQQLITGDAMSASRKLFWTAVGLAGVVAGGALAHQYLGQRNGDTGSNADQGDTSTFKLFTEKVKGAAQSAGETIRRNLTYDEDPALTHEERLNEYQNSTDVQKFKKLVEPATNAIAKDYTTMTENIKQELEEIKNDIKKEYPRLTEKAQSVHQAGVQLLEGVAGSETFKNISTKAKNVDLRQEPGFEDSDYVYGADEEEESLSEKALEYGKSALNSVKNAATYVKETAAEYLPKGFSAGEAESSQRELNEEVQKSALPVSNDQNEQ